MARARVVLRGCETFTGMTGESWRKGQARTIANEKQIRYYRNQSEFTITDLAESKPKSKPDTPPPDPNAGGDGDDGTGEGEGEGGGDEAFTDASLNRLTKAQLVDLAAEKWSLALDEDEMKKDDLISAILKAQG